MALPADCLAARLRRLAPAVALLCALLVPGRAASLAPEELADLDARIEYAYYVGDLRALTKLGEDYQTLSTSRQPWAAYQFAHLQFRRARLLIAKRDAPGARSAAGQCVEALKAEGASTPDPVEAQVLSLVCEAYASRFGHPVSQQVLLALSLQAPHNPRVALARAYGALQGAAQPSPAQRRDELLLARTAAETFAAPVAAQAGAPSFGAPRRRGCSSVGRRGAR